MQTTPGPPVACRAPRLAPVRLAVAKAGIRSHAAGRAEGLCSSALHLVTKKESGWKPRGAYQALNTRTIPERYPAHT